MHYSKITVRCSIFFRRIDDLFKTIWSMFSFMLLRISAIKKVAFRSETFVLSNTPTSLDVITVRVPLFHLREIEVPASAFEVTFSNFFDSSCVLQLEFFPSTKIWLFLIL